MENAMVNCSSKIWVFWNEDWIGATKSDTHQQLTIKFTHKASYKEMVITAVYERCSALERLGPWDDLECLAERIKVPWLIGGDFNVIKNGSEKLEGLPVTQQEVADFLQCINNYALTEIQFSGSVYTWWSGRIEEECIFKRLDRVFGNEKFHQEFTRSEVQHLIREGFDHASLHVICKTLNYIVGKPFRENVWPSHYQMLEHIPKLITEEGNDNMMRVLASNEVREAIFDHNKDNSCGPDGFSGGFYQTCWEIIKDDVINMIKVFFYGYEIPRHITHTTLNFYKLFVEHIYIEPVCKKWHPVVAQGTGASHTWKKMIKIREEVEHNIWWQVKAGIKIEGLNLE
ncbi:hypothetical protein RDI58_017885 [Solanum bulbocastanum]|uniref:Uncharacterized protein n=1 Tax=Solanum bulbocastanum TaxID=147425 RepID=A0AAN8TAB9_SOLBU